MYSNYYDRPYYINSLKVPSNCPKCANLYRIYLNIISVMGFQFAVLANIDGVGNWRLPDSSTVFNA